MFTLIKESIKQLSLPLLYIGSIFLVYKTAFKEAKWGLFLLVCLIPQPNIWHKLFAFPGGKEVLDYLILSIFIGIIIQKKGFSKSRNSIFIVILLLVSYLAVWNSSLRYSLPYPISTSSFMFKEWKNYAEMLLLYFLTLNVMKEENDQKNILLIMSLVILFITLRSYRNFTGGVSFDYDKRDPGPFMWVGLGSNHYGAFLSHFGVFFLGLYFYTKEKYKKNIYLATFVLSITALMFTYSRGAYMAILGAFSFFSLKKRGLIILVVILFFSWQFVLPTSVVDRIGMTEESPGQLDNSSSGRIVLWKLAIELFNQNPIFGVGYDGFGMNVPKGELTDTHNYYLLMLCEQGIIGFILFIITIIKSFHSGLRLFRTSEDTFYKGIGFGFMGCVIACAISNMFGNRWSYFMLGSYFWLLWGLVDRSIIINASRRSNENNS